MVILAVVGGAVAFVALITIFGLVVWLRPEKIALIRFNLLWLATLVAVLTLVFGMKLLELLESTPPPGSTPANTNTVEIVLSSLVGVGIGGLIAIAGQLVQDSGGNGPTVDKSQDEPDTNS